MAAATLSSSAICFFTSSIPASSTTQGSKTFPLFPILPLKPCVLTVSAKLRSPRSNFIRNVMVPSDIDQDVESGDENVEEGRAREANFSPDCKLFVGNLPFNVDSAELAELFGQAGTVEMVEVIYDRETGRSRGFAFVTMSSTGEAEAGAQQFNGYELDGRPLRVNAGPPPPRRDGPPQSGGFRSGGGSGGGGGNRLYIGNLSWGVDDLALENLFSEQGQVVEAKVVYDRDTGRSRGFGFVTYNSTQEVENAISSLNGADLDGRSIRVSVAESKPRRQF
ncbi:Ribonucleoprotein, chloroplastic [Zostera marina]|uniref:Ribonucleoprotein, chloroplastic n=1 Tax=Zostera marina TaxID=29655 RepID=A0A0K9PAH3_ZOSMR|nr:Ribonucleoprotein, chloroplastic [Zostera marina]